MSIRDPDQHEQALFLSAVADAVPLPVPKRVDVPKPAETTPGQLRRRAAAVQEEGRDLNPLASEVEMRYGPHDPIEFRRHGVQHGVFRKLKQGGYTIESRLDLHRLFVDAARRDVFGFIQECYANDLRTVLILHGKGERAEVQAKLKNYTAHWLAELETVQAFVSAQPQHGGNGALYVLLRKSERSRQETRRQFR